MSHGSFAAALTCLDGRIQDPVTRLLRERFSVEFVDTITEPGMVKFLTAENQSETLQSEQSFTLTPWLRAKLDISVAKHGARAIAVVAHADCAGNPIADEEQQRQLAPAATLVRSWYPSVPIVSVWVTPNETDTWVASVLEHQQVGD